MADRVLRSRGLRRNGLVYVLDKEDKVRELMNTMSLQFRNIQDAMARGGVHGEGGRPDPATYFELQQQVNALDEEDRRPIPDPARNRPDDPNAERGRELARQRHEQAAHQRHQVRLNLVDRMSQLQLAFAKTQSDYNSLGTFFVSERNALLRGQADLNAPFGQIQKDYEDLKKDPEVTAALLALNPRFRRLLALGPIENYKANLQGMAAGVLAEKGFQRKKGGGLILGADADLQAARSLVKTTRMDLAVALHRSQGLRDEAAARRKREADLAARESGEWPPTSSPRPSRKRPNSPKNSIALHADLAKLREEQADGEKALKDMAQDLGAKRESFVESVEILGKAVDASRQKREEVGGDREVAVALNHLKDKIGSLAEVRPARQPQSDPDLEDARKAIQVGEIALVPDRTALWVTATVNGVPGLKLVLDPSVEAVRSPSDSPRRSGSSRPRTKRP